MSFTYTYNKTIYENCTFPDHHLDQTAVIQHVIVFSHNNLTQIRT